MLLSIIHSVPRRVGFLLGESDWCRTGFVASDSASPVSLSQVSALTYAPNVLEEVHLTPDTTVKATASRCGTASDSACNFIHLFFLPIVPVQYLEIPLFFIHGPQECTNYEAMHVTLKTLERCLWHTHAYQDNPGNHHLKLSG
jgi:hypothetical protein